MIHQGLCLKAYFYERHYQIDEVAELAHMNEEDLRTVLAKAITPDEILEKIELVFHEPIEKILGFPEIRQN